MANVLVIGGHGKIALLLTPLLVEDGHEVTSVIRNPEHVRDVEEGGARSLVLDVESASTERLGDAIKGHDAVVWSAGAGGGNPERTYAVDRDAAIRSMDAAREAGVRRYVMVSYHGARLDHGVPESEPFFHYAEAKAAADAHLRSSGLDWTILGPGALTTEPPSGTIDPQPSGESRDTSRANVAQVIAQTLATPATIGRQIEFVDGTVPITEVLTG
ncbi:MAG: SDR family oxidoreductase [Mobilicoccus sp.]|nr:SDR family oxidoreductase [Mobilicoccus sp.]